MSVASVDVPDRVVGRVRYNSGDPNGVVSGYEPDEPSDGVILPPCGLVDVDRAVMALFDSTIPLYVKERGGVTKKVPVVFATGERFALLNKNKPIRDREGALILPLVSIRRTSVEQTDEDMTSRGINQHTGDLIVTRKLSPSDRSYQRLVNKLAIKNASGIATRDEDPSPVGTSGSLGALRDDRAVLDGEFLRPFLGDNVFEIVTAPQPQFYTARYEISFWTQYTQQMNQMLEVMFSSQLPQGRAFRLDTDKGYWFVLYVDETKQASDNFEDFTGDERIVRYTFTCRALAYLFAADPDGAPVSVRKMTSAPRVSFSIEDPHGDTTSDDPRAGADDPTRPFTLTGDPTVVVAPRRGEDAIRILRFEKNPFTGRDESKFLRPIFRNARLGETVYVGQPVDHLADV